MEIRIDGNRSSSENWMRAQTASVRELPNLSPEEKHVAARLGVGDEAYARNILAFDFERRNLEKKAAQAAQLIEKFASRKIAGLHVSSVWLKTFDGKFRFDVEYKGGKALIFVSEDLIDDLLQSGSKTAEEQIERVIEFSLPSSWMVVAS